MKKLVRVKICGITRAIDANLACELGAWAVGFIFYKKSPRYCSPVKAAKIISQLTPLVTPVGVFVNEKPQTVIKIAKSCKLHALQFHGDETPAYCQKFKGYKIIKAIRVKPKTTLKSLQSYKVDAILLDTYQEGLFGGTGKVFNWSKARLAKRLKVPIILSGGLSPSNVALAIKEVKPYSVDVSSGVEVKPGVKSPVLLKSLFKKISA